MKTSTTWITVVCCSLLGCMSQIPSVKDWSGSWVGEPVTRVISLTERPGEYASKVNWKDYRYELGNGNWVYVAPIRENCLVHFEVNTQGIIVGYRTEGDRCY